MDLKFLSACVQHQQVFLPADLSLQLVSDVSNHNQAEVHVLKPQKKSYDFYSPLAKVVPHEAGTQKHFMLQNSMCSLGPKDEQKHLQELTSEYWRSLTALLGLLLGAGVGHSWPLHFCV